MMRLFLSVAFVGAILFVSDDAFARQHRWHRISRRCAPAPACCGQQCVPAPCSSCVAVSTPTPCASSACGTCATVVDNSTQSVVSSSTNSTQTATTDHKDSDSTTQGTPAPTAEELEWWAQLVKNGYEQKDFDLLWVKNTPEKRREMYDHLVELQKEEAKAKAELNQTEQKPAEEQK